MNSCNKEITKSLKKYKKGKHLSNIDTEKSFEYFKECINLLYNNESNVDNKLCLDNEALLNKINNSTDNVQEMKKNIMPSKTNTKIIVLPNSIL